MPRTRHDKNRPRSPTRSSGGTDRPASPSRTSNKRTGRATSPRRNTGIFANIEVTDGVRKALLDSGMKESEIPNKRHELVKCVWNIIKNTDNPDDECKSVALRDALGITDTLDKTPKNGESVFLVVNRAINHAIKKPSA